MRWLVIPTRLLGWLAFTLFLVRGYAFYRARKQALANAWRPAKNRFVFPLATRHVAHAVLILITVFVATNSLKARELRPQDPLQSTVLSAWLQYGDEDDEIVEKADAFLAKSKRHEYGIGGISLYDAAPVAVFASEPATAQDNSSLIKPDLATTSETPEARTSALKHTVEGGETISTIAELYGISQNTIRWENNLGTSDLIKPGQILTILPTTGVSHRVRAGETLSAIATAFKASADDIIEFNKLATADAISEGQVLILPGGSITPPPPPTPTTRLAQRDDVIGPVPPSAAVTGSNRLQWPTLSRRINQGFRGRYGHTGIDIDGDLGHPIYAAESGRVTSAGWRGGYGLAVMVDHGNGTTTLYGHASKLYVKAGQYVSRGQTVAAQGTTGRSTGVHLHFEVRRGGSYLNPFNYL